MAPAPTSLLPAVACTPRAAPRRYCVLPRPLLQPLNLDLLSLPAFSSTTTATSTADDFVTLNAQCNLSSGPEGSQDSGTSCSSWVPAAAQLPLPALPPSGASYTRPPAHEAAHRSAGPPPPSGLSACPPISGHKRPSVEVQQYYHGLPDGSCPAPRLLEVSGGSGVVLSSPQDHSSLSAAPSAPGATSRGGAVPQQRLQQQQHPQPPPASSPLSLVQQLAARYFADFGAVADVPDHLEAMRARVKRQRVAAHAAAAAQQG